MLDTKVTGGFVSTMAIDKAWISETLTFNHDCIIDKNKTIVFYLGSLKPARETELRQPLK